MFSCVSCVSKVIPIVHVFPVCEEGLVNLVIGCSFRGWDVIQSFSQGTYCRCREVFIR